MKRFFKLISIGVVFGLSLLICKSLFKMSDQSFKVFTWYIFGAVILGALGFNLIYTHPMRKKVFKFMKMIESGQAEECIPEMEQLLKEAKKRKSKKRVQFYQLNLSAGYIETRRFEDAIKLLKKIDPQSLKSDMQLVYYINLCTAYFMVNDKDAVLESYSAGQKLFETYRKNRHYASNIAVVNILAYVCQGSLDKAKDELAEAKETYANLRFKRTFEEIERIINEDEEGA